MEIYDEKEVDGLCQAIVYDAEHEEEAATHIASTLGLEEQNYPKARGVVNEFVTSYKNKKEDVADREWLVASFKKYPKLWKSDTEIEADAETIISAIALYEKSKNELDVHLKSGKAKESWLAKKIEQGAMASGVQNVASYSQKIENAIDAANEAMANTLCRKTDGLINQNPNLDGFIAEQHHVDTFNIDAAAKEKAFYAEAQNSTGKDSVDIFINDARGEHVRKYQSKYGKDAETTQEYFDNGNYRGQRKLVPEGQTDSIKNSTDKIEFQGVSSKPLSKEKAKEMQRNAQENQKLPEYQWNDISRATIAKRIGIKAGISAAVAVGFQGARIVGRRIVNAVTGKENKPLSEDVQEFVKSSLESSVAAGVTTAVAGGLTVAAKSGFLGKVLRNTPVGIFANVACIGVENVKVLHKLAKGEITGLEAVDRATNATCSLIGGMAGAAKGATVGAALGTALGPVGTTVGGIVGGMVGGMAGGAVGDAIQKAGKTIVKDAVTVVKESVKAVKNLYEQGKAFVKAFRDKLKSSFA